MMALQSVLLVVCGLLMVWPTMTLQSPWGAQKVSLSGCTFRAADSQELLYAPMVCDKKMSGCPAQTWTMGNRAPFDLALWSVNVTGKMVLIKNEGRNGGYLTTFDGKNVVVSSKLGAESMNWVFYISGYEKANIENANFGTFLTLDKIFGNSSDVYLDPNPMHYWHFSCERYSSNDTVV